MPDRKIRRLIRVLNQDTELETLELNQDTMELAVGGTFTPNTYKKDVYHSVGISTDYRLLLPDQFKFMGRSITYEEANRIVEIANKVDKALNSGFRDNNKVGHNEPAFIRAFNSQLQIEFGMTWNGHRGYDFDCPLFTNAI